ncbi:MAG: hypothetical protein AAB433_15480 [Nitrospirota bacterium]
MSEGISQVTISLFNLTNLNDGITAGTLPGRQTGQGRMILIAERTDAIPWGDEPHSDASGESRTVHSIGN